MAIIKKCSRPRCINLASVQPVFKVPLIIGGTDPTKASRRLAPMVLSAPPVCKEHASARPRDYAGESYWKALAKKYKERNLVALWSEMSVEFHPLSLDQKLKGHMTIGMWDELRRELKNGRG